MSGSAVGSCAGSADFRRSRSGRCLGGRSSAVAILILSVASPAQAQSGFELSPYAGLWLPTAKVVDDDPSLSPTLFTDIEHRPALVVGARLTYWLSESLGLEGAIAYAKSRVQSQVFSSLDAPFGFAPNLVDGEVTSYGGRILWRPFVPGDWAAPHLGLGLSVVSRSSPAYMRLDGTRDVGFFLGAGVRLGLTERVAVRIDLEDHMYPVSFRVPVIGGSAETVSRFQHDLVISQSIAISLSGGDADAR